MKVKNLKLFIYWSSVYFLRLLLYSDNPCHNFVSLCCLVLSSTLRPVNFLKKYFLQKTKFIILSPTKINEKDNFSHNIFLGVDNPLLLKSARHNGVHARFNTVCFWQYNQLFYSHKIV